MDKRTHRIISLFLIISLLFAGLYMDAIPAEDFFVYDLTGTTAASLAPVHTDINTTAICTTASSAVPGIDLQTRARYQQRYREVSEFLYLLYSGSGSISQGKSYIHHTATYLFHRTQNELITEYVYQSDGKKRI
ncbi:hypothetical protein D7V83_05530 [bacterium 0.1xD8-71]|nr:hypothetical protein D7V83_05530 [bacterium 0.1xD8-71]